MVSMSESSAIVKAMFMASAPVVTLDTSTSIIPSVFVLTFPPSITKA